MPKKIKPEEKLEENPVKQTQEQGQTDKAEPKTKKLSLLLRERTKDIHKELEQEPFLQRYKTDGLTMEDHFLHLVELHAIYVQLTARMVYFKLQKATDTATDTFYIQTLLTTATRIETDLNKIKKLLPKDSKLKHHNLDPSSSTSKYVDHLRSLKTPEELLAHCCVRWFGDSFGGQKLKARIITLSVPYGLNEKSAPINFHEKSLAPKKLMEKLNALGELDSFDDAKKEAFLSESVKAFEFHQPIFKELEGKRGEYLNPKKYNNALIFGGVALTAAAIGVGYYLLKEK